MKEVDPKNTSRALAFELWMKAPVPMVTLMKTLDVTALVRLSRKQNYRFNMLLCWCIGKVAAEIQPRLSYDESIDSIFAVDLQLLFYRKHHTMKWPWEEMAEEARQLSLFEADDEP